MKKQGLQHRDWLRKLVIAECDAVVRVGSGAVERIGLVALLRNIHLVATNTSSPITICWW